MLPPHELKNRNFTKSMRGYNPVEVDEYIDFLIEKYTELYRENDELERKLKSAAARLEEMKNDEDSIRSALVDAKRAASHIKADAEDRAEAIIRSAKASCNAILSDFNEKIENGRGILAELKADTLSLKKELFERYSNHIRYIDTLTEGIDESEIAGTEELRRKAVSSIKQSMSDAFAAPEAASPAAETAEEAGSEFSEESAPMSFESAPAGEPVDTVLFDIAKDAEVVPDEPELQPEADTLNVEREPLNTKKSLKDSVKELNRQYREQGDVINTPDSDLGDDSSYLDFVKSVTGKDSEKKDKKADDFDMLFSDSNKK